MNSLVRWYHHPKERKERKKMINIDKQNTMIPEQARANPFSLVFWTVHCTDGGNQCLVSTNT